MSEASAVRMFNKLTLEEQARINVLLAEKGVALVAWDDRQDELAAAYKPARTMLWVDRPIPNFPEGQRAIDAWKAYCVTADRVGGMPHYPDMTQYEKDAMAFASCLAAMKQNDYPQMDYLRLIEKPSVASVASVADKKHTSSENKRLILTVKPSAAGNAYDYSGTKRVSFAEKVKKFLLGV